MDLKNQNILFFSRTMGLGGTENVVLQLCEIFKPYVNNIVVCSCGGVNEKKLAELGVKHYTVADIENKNPKKFFEILLAVFRIIYKEKITVVHTHHRMAAFYAKILRCVKNFYFVNTSHNVFQDKIKLTNFIYKKANLIACGEMVKQNLVSCYGLPESAITVIHNAVKPFEEEIEPDKVLTELHTNGFFVVGNVGRLSEQKGMEYFIKAVPEILKKHPKTKFLIVGTGVDKERLKNLSAELKLDEYILFFGYREDIQNLMAQMDLVVLSSLWEGLPLTPIEAFSVGKTIVATAVDGTVEIVNDGENGFLVPPRDSEAIADKVCCLIEQQDLKKKFEEKARDCFENEFSFEKLAQEYISYYEGL